jgi:arginase family enzyme
VSHRLALVVAVWAAATAFGLAIARWTAVGPVVLILGGGHGVHVGDLVALAAAYAEAVVLTRRLLRRA